MIISHIIGGLGNQMFQYAAGRALSLERRCSLRLDISVFDSKDLHQGFELQRVFNFVSEIATEADVRHILGWQFPSSIRRILVLPGMVVFRRKGFVVEPQFDYWSELSNVPRNSYLVGYWQSEKYFKNVASIIRGDFTFKRPLVNRNIELAEQIGSVNAVSLHVRRGDYASNPKTNATHGLCSINYYNAAINYMAERVESPEFFIFSDDIAWVRKNVDIRFPCEYVDHNKGLESYNDMRLMSLCQHHIIANSSFSWWGAWLNPSAEKIVIAPKKWFANANKAEDLFPQGWVTL